jgi:hypothetical protein
MQAWTEVVTHPLGLAGFSLFIVFALLARMGPSRRSPWLAPAAVTMAFIALLGGIGLAFRQISHSPVSANLAPAATRPAKSSSPEPTGSEAAKTETRSVAPDAPRIEQRTSGGQSPAVADVQGNVTITIQDDPPKKP